jgi:hypothetical protein
MAFRAFAFSKIRATTWFVTPAAITDDPHRSRFAKMLLHRRTFLAILPSRSAASDHISATLFRYCFRDSRLSSRV